MRQEIEELASVIFDTEEIYVIHELIRDYCGLDEANLVAISRLRHVIPSRPKRPMYYIHYKIGLLPQESRFVVEQSGSQLPNAVNFKQLSNKLAKSAIFFTLTYQHFSTIGT